MALEKIRPRVVDATGNYAFNNVDLTGNISSRSANVADLTGVNNLVASGNSITLTGSLSTTANVSAGNIKTNHLLYANGVAWSLGESSTVSGANTQVQFNDASTLGASANFTFNKDTSTLTVTKISGNGAALTSLTGGNVVGSVPNAVYSSTAGSADSATTAGTVTTAAQPNITSVGTLTTLNITGNLTAGNANLGNLTISNFFSGSGNGLSNIQGSNVSGAVSYATTANGVAGSNVTGAVTYASTANAVAGANVLGQVANALVADTVTTAAQGNITSLGTLTGLTSNGIVNFTNASNVALGTVSNVHITGGSSGQYLSTDGSGTLSWVNVSSSSTLANGNSSVNIPSANGNVNISAVGNANVLVVTGTGANIAGTANITGNLSAGNIIAGSGTGGNITNANVISANTFTASGNVTAGNIKSDNLLYANGSPYVFTVAASGSNTQVQFNDSNVFAGSANFTFNKTSNTLSVTNIVANGSGLTSLTGSNVSGQVANALVAGTVYTAAQTNITSLGTLTGLAVTGDTTLTGNLTVSGTFEYANVTSFRVKDPIIEQGGDITGSALTSNDGYDRGQLLHYYSGSSAVDAFMGWDNSNAEFAFGSNVSIASEVATFNTYGNVRAGFFMGNGSQLTGITALSAGYIANGNSNVNIPSANGNVNISVANVANVLVVTSTGANLTGTLNVSGDATVGNIVTGTGSGGNITGANIISANTLTASGNITAGNANLGNAVVANYFIGSGANLSSLAGGNVSGQVANALVAGTVYTAAQPNITSVGTLTSLAVTGNTTSGNFIGTFANGNSNVSIPSANGNINFNAEGNANIVAITGTGVNVTGTFDSTGNIHTSASANIDGLLTVSSSNGNDATKGIAFPLPGGALADANASIRYYHYGNFYQTVFEIGVGNNLINASGQDSINLVASGGVGVKTLTPSVEFEVTGRAKVSGNTEIGGLLAGIGNVAFSGANVTLGAVANLHITGGSTGQYLQTDGSGTLSWATVAGGGGSNINNGNSNVNIPSANSNVNISVANNPNIVVVTSTGANINGYANITGNVSLSGANVSLGSVSNLHIAGGSNTYVLSTDGTGNLSWASATGSSLGIAVDNFTGNGVAVNYTLASTPANINCTIVSIAGLFQPRTVYSLSGNVVTFSSAPKNTAPIEITTLSSTGGGSGSALTIQDEGSNLTTTASLINFVGNGISSTNVGNSVTVTVNTGGITAQDLLSPFLLMGA